MRRLGFRHPTIAIGEPAEHRDDVEGRLCPAINPSATIEAFCTVDAGIERPTYIGPDVWLMKGCHVGHDCMIFDGSELAPHCALGGHVIIGKGVKVGLGAIFKPYVTVGDGARIGAGAVVVKDVPPGETWVGNPARKLVSESALEKVVDLVKPQVTDMLAKVVTTGLQPVQVTPEPPEGTALLSRPRFDDSGRLVAGSVTGVVAGGKVASHRLCPHGPEGRDCPYCEWAEQEGA